MEDQSTNRQPAVWTLLSAGVVLGVTILSGAWIAKHGAPTGERVAVIAGLVALGTMACAALGTRSTPYPKWAYWATAGMMSGVVMLSALFMSPERWLADTRQSVWMVPWFFMMLASVPAQRTTRGVCATAGPRAGWILMGAGMLLTGILLLPSWTKF